MLTEIKEKVMLFAGGRANDEHVGGWEDFKGYFDSVAQAKEFAIAQDKGKMDKNIFWFHIVYDGKIVAEHSRLLEVTGEDKWINHSRMYDPAYR